MNGETPEPEVYDLVVKKEEEKASVFAGGVGMLTPKAIEQADLTSEAVKKVKQLAFKVTNERDWLDMGGNAYLTESGCKKVGALFGVSLKNTKVETEDSIEPQRRTYTATVTCEFRGREVVEIGTCDSEDRFFAKGRRFEDRDFTSMRKKAVTNAMNRAVKAILGLKGILMSEVREALGKDSMGRVGKVEYGAKKNPPRDFGEDTSEIRDKLWKMCMDLAGGDEEVARQGCAYYSSFTAKDGKEVQGFTDPFNPKIKAGWIKSAYKSVKERWLEKGFGSGSLTQEE